MFHHAASTSKSGHHCAIHWSRWEPYMEWDLMVESTVIDLVWPDSSQEDIADLYCDVYQLWRPLGKICCSKETKECIHQDILDSIKECLWSRWPFMLLEAEQRQSLVGAPIPSPQAEFMARTHATYDRFMGIRQESCKEALAMARDTHWWALAATVLLEEKIEDELLSQLQSLIIQEAADAQAAASKRHPRLWIIKPKSPRQCHTMGTLPKGDPSHWDLPNQDSG